MVDNNIKQVFHRVFDDCIDYEIDKINKNITDRTNGSRFELSLDFTSQYERAKDKIRELPDYKNAIDALYKIDVVAIPVMARVKAELDELVESAIKKNLQYKLDYIDFDNDTVKMTIVRVLKANTLTNLAETLQDKGLVIDQINDNNYGVINENNNEYQFIITTRDHKLAFATESRLDSDQWYTDPAEIKAYAQNMLQVARTIEELNSEADD